MKDDINTTSGDKLLDESRKEWSRIRECDYEKHYRKQMKSDIKYFTGEDQGWSDDGAREKLEKAHLPALTLNRISPILRLICGARPKTEAKFIPSEEGDLDTTDVMNSCKDHVDRVNTWEFQEAEAFKNGVILSRAVAGIFPSYDQDVRGEVEISLYPGDEFYLDPDSKRKDRKDSDNLFRALTIKPDKAKRLWPNKKDAIENLIGQTTKGDESGSPGHDSGKADEYQDPESNYYDAASDKLTVVYRWYKEWHKVTKIIDMAMDDIDGEPVVYDSTKSVQEIIKKLEKFGPEAKKRYKPVALEYPEVKYIVFAGDIEFERGDNPWNREDGKRTMLSDNFPYVVFEPDRLVTGARQELISLIEAMKDPQKYHNKLASAIIHLIGTTANSGWEYEKKAPSSQKWADKLKESGSKPGFIMEWAKGVLTEGRARKITPTMPDQGTMAEAKVMGDELLDISGVESLVSVESLGKSASGKAIDRKMSQGANIISWVYDSFRLFQYVLTEYTRDAIQYLFDYEKVIRIKGRGGFDKRPQYMRINEALYDEEGGITQILNDVTVGIYDVIVSDKEVMPSDRIERFRYFVDLVKTGALQLPREVMVKVVAALMDDPQLKEIIENELTEYQQTAIQQTNRQAMAAQGGMMS